MEEAVREAAVFRKKVPEAFGNGEDAVPVLDINKFKGYLCSPFHGIFITTGETETAVASERDKFKAATLGHPYMALPKEGSPQCIIFLIFSSSYLRGWRVDLI